MVLKYKLNNPSLTKWLIPSCHMATVGIRWNHRPCLPPGSAKANAPCLWHFSTGTQALAVHTTNTTKQTSWQHSAAAKQPHCLWILGLCQALVELFTFGSGSWQKVLMPKHFLRKRCLSSQQPGTTPHEQIQTSNWIFFSLHAQKQNTQPEQTLHF